MIYLSTLWESRPWEWGRHRRSHRALWGSPRGFWSRWAASCSRCKGRWSPPKSEKSRTWKLFFATWSIFDAHLCRTLPDDGEDPLEIVFCQVILQKHLTRRVYNIQCILDLLFNQRLKNCNWTHLTKRLSSFLSRFSMRTSHDISSYFSHTLTSYLLITLPGSHPRSWGGCSCPEQRMSSDLSSSARSPGNRISLKYITWHKHQFLMM